MNVFKLLIDGQLVDGASSIDVINPATGEVFQQAPRADEVQLNTAIEAAKNAFSAWSATAIDYRRELLIKLADAIDARLGEFAKLLTREQGRPIEQAQGEIFFCSYTLRLFAGMELAPKVLKEDDNAKVVEYRQPLGVVATITPWNFPLLMVTNKLAPALLAGNTLVIKPAPTTPLTTLMLGELCADIFPAGVVNTVVDNNDLGGLITSDPDVAKVAFTGSTATGKKVLASSAETLKRLTLELGGNDAALVLDDVDVKAVAAQIYNCSTYNAGQICVAIKRVYVPDALYDEFCNELARLANNSVVGDGFEPGVQVGPLQNKLQFEKVKRLLEDTKKRGNIIAGGEALNRPGYFIAPTIVRDIDDKAKLVAGEQFAPILPVLKYSDLDDALARINATEFGLAGSVWGTDIDRAASVAQRIDSGSVWVNSHMALDPAVPFRGAKQSGLGVELGQEGLYEYTQAKVITVPKNSR
ncbi:aldehyde dehydrogenase family protein [Halioxenophilus sp. WMMB6]|uniref:aldehyde dehydrogenase family protein n=1 Tax=Halioxenophilus sp. WMMB6 TaxID=3073815 RepID=UPI00295EB6DA|nr:aldehyde dehydrogenase family protein [Halioxenophilus sp. WMMB6]